MTANAIDVNEGEVRWRDGEWQRGREAERRIWEAERQGGSWRQRGTQRDAGKCAERYIERIETQRHRDTHSVKQRHTDAKETETEAQRHLEKRERERKGDTELNERIFVMQYPEWWCGNGGVFCVCMCGQWCVLCPCASFA